MIPMDKDLFTIVKAECSKLLRAEAFMTSLGSFENSQKSQAVFNVIDSVKSLMFNQVRVISGQCENDPQSAYNALQQIASIVKAVDMEVEEFLNKELHS